MTIDWLVDWLIDWLIGKYSRMTCAAQLCTLFLRRCQLGTCCAQKLELTLATSINRYQMHSVIVANNCHACMQCHSSAVLVRSVCALIDCEQLVHFYLASVASYSHQHEIRLHSGIHQQRRYTHETQSVGSLPQSDLNSHFTIGSR